MKAIVRSKYGPPDILELKDIEAPTPKENQVLVRVHAASVNPLDWHLLRGDPFIVRFMGFGFLKPKLQATGADFAGTVEAIGSDVSHFKVGDQVFGAGRGSFAEYLCVGEDLLAIKPTNLNYEQAAAVPVAALTALQGLRVPPAIQSGDRVLIIGAAGGVGSFAVQIAKSFGAHVTGVCSGEKMALVRSIGADDVIDYAKEDFTARRQEFGVILDNAAFGSIRLTLRALAPRGTYVLIGGSMKNFFLMTFFQRFLSTKRGRTVTGLMANVNRHDLTSLRELLEAGKIVPTISRRYPLSETAEAIRQVERGHTAGKVVITVRP